MRHPLRPVLLIVAALMLLSIDHGLPNRYLPDDTAVRCALGIARDLHAGELPLSQALAPPPDRYTTYPMLLPWLDLGVLGARFLVGLVAGRWDGPGAFREAVMQDPGMAWLPARLLSVLLALLIPLSVYRAGRELARPRGESALAALLAGSSLLLVQYAHTVRPWAPMLGFGALSLWFSLRMLRRQRLADVLAAWIAAALSGASFQVGLAFLGLPAVASVLALWRPRGEAGGAGTATVAGAVGRGRLAWRLTLGLSGAVLVLVVLGYPHVLLHRTLGDTQGGQAARLGVGAELALGGQSFDLSRLAGSHAAAVLRSWFGYDPLLLLLGPVGLLLLWKRLRSAAMLLVIAPAAAWVLLFALYDGTHVRYFLPAMPFLALGAGAALASLVRGAAGGRGRREPASSWIPRPRLALGLALLALPLVQAARLDLLLGRADTRTLAAARLLSLVPPDTRMAVDGMGSCYGPPVLPRGDVLAEVAAAGVWLGRLERAAVERFEQGLPEPPAARALLPVQRFWRYDSYYPSDYLLDGISVAQWRERGVSEAPDGSLVEPVPLEQWLERWHAGVFVQVDRKPDAERRAPLTELLKQRGRLLWQVSPTGSADPFAAELPTDMGYALTDLWRYRRPGPWIRVWSLERRGA